MFASYVRLREYGHNLRNNERGVVSFEYVIVAFAVVSAVALAFGTGTGGAIKDALTTAISAIILKLPA